MRGKRMETQPMVDNSVENASPSLASSQLRLTADSARFLTWQPMPRDAAEPIAAALRLHADTTPPLGAALQAPLPFWPGRLLIALRFAGETFDHFCVLRAGEAKPDCVLDGTNEPIYRLSEGTPPLLTAETAPLYARFFFHFVRGQLGYFVIVETLDDIPWADTASPDDKADIAACLIPLTLLGKDAQACLCLTGTVLFRNALFRTNIAIATRAITRLIDHEPVELARAQIALENETLLREDLPILLEEPRHE